MSYPIELPHVGESVTEAAIGKWLVAVGDHIEKFEPMVEVVTDKVNMEFPAPESGTITEIIIGDGETAPMGAVIGQMDPDDPDATPVSGKIAERSSERSDGEVGINGEMISGANVGPTGGTFADTSQSSADPSRALPSQVAQTTESASAGDRSQHYSPVVMRLAREHDVDLSAITGTGLGGRVSKKDVLRAVDARAYSLEAQPVSSTKSDQDADQASTEDTLVTPSPIRMMIANNMSRSWREIPHAWSSIETDVTGLVRLRESQKEYFRSRHSVSLTYLSFSLYAVAAALRANPLANAAWIDGKIRHHAHVNVGIAVAAEEALIVPVIRDCDQKSIAELAEEVVPMIERAKAGKLTLEDVQGGTFTLNNTGALGSVWGGAIINPPQAAILNTEAIVKRPMVVESPDGDSIAIRSMMNLSLSFDHRIMDGAEASQFIQAVRTGLEAFNPDTRIT